MPKVGNRSFPSTAKGKAAAKAAAKKKGGYALGGMAKTITSAKGKKGVALPDSKSGKGIKPVPKGDKKIAKLPKAARNKMGFK